jgi:hypothetical protein
MTRTWIERDFKRADVSDFAEAKQILKQRWPEAVFLETIELDAQRITHVHARPRRGDDRLHSPDAVIVEDLSR